MKLLMKLDENNEIYEICGKTFLFNKSEGTCKSILFGNDEETEESDSIEGDVSVVAGTSTEVDKGTKGSAWTKAGTSFKATITSMSTKASTSSEASTSKSTEQLLTRLTDSDCTRDDYDDETTYYHVPFENNNNNEWTNEAVLLLINKFEENKTVLNKKNSQKKHIWQRIANEMAEFGYAFTFDQLQNKWKSLLRTYKSIRDNNNKSGRNRKNWHYFDHIDRLMSKNPAIDPPVAIHMGDEILNESENDDESSSSTGFTLSNNSSEATEVEPCRKRKKKVDTNEILLLAINESKRQHEEDIVEKRNFNKLLEKLIQNLEGNK